MNTSEMWKNTFPSASQYQVHRHLTNLTIGTPATLSSSQPSGITRKPSLKGLGIDISKTQKQPSYTNVPYPIESPQQSKSGWFKRDKKRDSTTSQPPAQAPQLPHISLGPAPPAIPPKIVSPGITNGGMAYSPHKAQNLQYDRRASYQKDDYIAMPMAPPVIPPKPADKYSPIQVPGQQNKPVSVPPVVPIGSLPTIRRSSPLLGDVFGETFNVNRRTKLEEAPRLESPRRGKSPIRQPLVNTFMLQAQQLEKEEKEKAATQASTGQSTKVGRQLSATSTVASTMVDKPPSSQPASPDDDASVSGSKAGFFSHFRKRARKRMSANEEESSPETSSAMPISPLPQLRLGGENSLRNSIVMEDFYEDAEEDLEHDRLRTMKELDYAMAAGYRPPQQQHITIAPAPSKSQSSH